MTDNKNVIGAALTRLREVAGLTQAQAAELIGTNPSQLSKVENGEKPVTNKWVGNAFSVLGQAASSKPKVTL